MAASQAEFSRIVVGQNRSRLGNNFAIFLLFFGVATLEALQTRNWLKAVLWLTLGIVFLAADNPRSDERQEVN